MLEPTTENGATDSLIVIIFGIFQFFIIFFLLFMSGCSWGCCGESYLNDRNETLSTFNLSIAFVIFQALITCIFKRGTFFFGFAFLIILSTVLISVKLWHDIPSLSDYYEEFETQKWKQERPIEMVRVFFEDKQFIGKTSTEIIEVLGQDYDRDNGNVIEYDIKNTYMTTLAFIFENDTVVNYELYCYD